MIMMTEANSLGFISGAVDDDVDLSMDFDTFFHILDESSDPCQTKDEEPSSGKLKVESTADVGGNMSLELHSAGSQLLEAETLHPIGHYPSYNLEASDSGNFTMAFDGLKMEDSLYMTPSTTSLCQDFSDWVSPSQGGQGGDVFRVSQSEIHKSANASIFDEVNSTLGSENCSDDLDVNLLLGKTGTQFRHLAGAVDSTSASCDIWIESMDEKSGYPGDVVENTYGVSVPENDDNNYVDKSCMNANIPSYDAILNGSTFCHNSTITNELGSNYLAPQFDMNVDYSLFGGSPQYSVCGDFKFDHVLTMNKEKDEIRESQTLNAYYASEMSMIDNIAGEEQNAKCQSSIDNRRVDGEHLLMPFCHVKSGISEKQSVSLEDRKVDQVVTSKSTMRLPVQAALNRGYSYRETDTSFVENVPKQSVSSLSMPIFHHKPLIHAKDEKRDVILTSAADGTYATLNAARQSLQCSQRSVITSKHPIYIKDEKEVKVVKSKGLDSNHFSRVSPESIQSNSLGSKSHVDDDSEICILEDISQPPLSNQSISHGKIIDPFHYSAYGDTIHHPGVGALRTKIIDERVLYQAALQDLSQPKSEANPPEGVLTVSLLRHQRIALSWMVRMETSIGNCLGGILADDQGLGKTISTIALILKERPPFREVDLNPIKKENFETFDLDGDDDGIIEVDGMKQVRVGCEVKSSSLKIAHSLGQSKGRPAAGTLVVCPTSVLRQWAEELHKKVSSEANLSVLVYHGSNRTKDPSELAKYDVVLTTYSIVSMEVPKQSVISEDDEEKREDQGNDVSLVEYSSGKKRKHSPSSGKNGSKNKKGLDGILVDSLARPLAKVSWFRVVLDEAQSIKNRRTQVARACWGLRAKRRWCLSGTPLQNAIDDLYSYFKFLRYDPYCSYPEFCSRLKVPIQKNPVNGYKRLQAILKTIMLRRTKGTLLDGEPIITLPPKVIELRKVEFTEEERDFYTRLETDSRAQFKEYAAAGTVKQNYVNILLMLLRLRQACDHPLLVRDLDSNTFGRSSVEMAKKLSQEKQLHLLNCLEGSLAICGICNDPPEDAAVTTCSHVFCKQCICEHLTGDDNQCPVSNCKERLNMSSVFSKATLSSSLSNHPDQDGSSSKSAELFKSYSEGSVCDSSKIRAAIEVLQSLTRAQNYISATSTSENSSDEIVSTHPNLFVLENSHGHCTDKKSLLVKSNLTKPLGEKAIVFSQWTRMLDLLEARLKSSFIQYRRLDGTMSVVARDKAVKDFNTLPEVSVMIMSLKAASLGLNMVAACRVLLLDLWWNPTTEDQAIDRAHRIGQTRPVSVLRLTVKDTVEDRILALQQKKREMVSHAFGEDETGGQQTRLTVEDLHYLFNM
ncbi:hypothetical protein K2173_001522 [Erythroxylum novogranatense]|uniref:Helicase-like transcription factor CHR28 n=1 Tax=Erythroxylum novogranatense TaxID=1862640 RepID=A0AAV8T3T5_9ROSI|nr:hypothetical protein K2173_001522 [Erythroxylum novogranatense]